MSREKYKQMVFTESEILEWEMSYMFGDYITNWRRPLTGEISIEGTAEAAGIDLWFKYMYGFDGRFTYPLVDPPNPRYDWPLIPYGPKNRPCTIKLNDEDITESEMAYVLGHELGHLVQANHGVEGTSDQVEYKRQDKVAEYFARRFWLAGGVELPPGLPDVPKPNLLESAMSGGQNWSEL